MKQITAIIVAAIINLYVPVAVSAYSAETLLQICRTEVGTGSYCDGYIAGFYDGRTTDDYGKVELMSCPPTDSTGENLVVTLSQMRLVFIKWAEQNPDKLHWKDWQAVRQAFADAWPCQ